MQTILRNLLVTAAFSTACVCAQVQVISQVADGGGWSSTLVATNATSTDTIASFTFHQDTSAGATQSWTPTFLENVTPAALAIPAGSSVFLHTPGTANSVSQGWAQLVGGAGVQAYVIYTFKSAGKPNQDATAPAVTAANRILVPFDNTSGLVTAVAVVNPNGSNLSISTNFKTSGGAVSTGSLPNLPPQGQMAFLLPDQFAQTAGQKGLAEFYSTSGTFTIIALRANPTGAFTSAPVYFESGTPIISTGGGSGGGGGAGDIVDAAFSIGIMNLTTGGKSQTSDIVSGAISRFTPDEWNAPFSGTKYGPCIVYDTTYSLTGNIPGVGDALLDAGSKLGFGGPNLPAGTTVPSISSPIGPIYNATFPAGTFAPGGMYTLTGPGGADVKSFKVSATLPTDFTVANWAALSAVQRSGSFTINWTGGKGDEIVLSLSTAAISGLNVHAVYIGCTAQGSAGTLTVPGDAMAHLLATANGSLNVEAVQGISGSSSPLSINATSFLPDLVAGGKANYGAFVPFIGYSKTVAVQ